MSKRRSGGSISGTARSRGDVAPRAVLQDTKARLLDTAEALFAERGFSQTSLREVTRAAGVNIAAVHYHFGSREALMRALFERRIAPLNAERLAMLGVVEAKASGGAPSLEAVVRAFVAPALRSAREPDRRRFMRVMARGLFEPGSPVLRMQGELFSHVFLRFSAAIQAAVPELPARGLRWGFRFMIGAMVQALMMDADPVHAAVSGSSSRERARLAHRSPGSIDVGEVIDDLVAFVTAGFRSLAAREDGTG